jgi:hypothetical protein
MLTRLFLAALCLCGTRAVAQLEGHNWVFWDSIGLSFMSDIPELINTFKFPTGDIVSVSDMSGVLRFVTNGKNTWVEDFELLDDTINNGLYFENGFDFHSALSSILIDNKVYSIYLYGDWTVDNGSIRASLLDLNIGQFIYIDSVIDIYAISSFTPIYNLRALRHGNGRDWWIVTFGTEEFHEYPFEVGAEFAYKIITLNNGLFTSHSQIGSETYYSGDHNEITGTFEFDNNGNFFFKAAGKNGYLYQFDRCSGAILLVDSLTGVDSIEISSIAFSPDDSKLYLTTTTSYVGLGLPYSPSSIYQYCLDCGVDIASTKDTIYQFPNDKYQFSGMKLGPDGKIYLTAARLDLGEDDPLPDYQTHFWVINHPDSLGAACDLDTASISSGGRNLASSFPNIPNYQLEAWRGSPCDTLDTANAVIEPLPPAFQVYPNPVSKQLYINNPFNTNYQTVVYNLQGQVIFNSNLQPGSNFVDTTYWPDGCYSFQILIENQTVFSTTLIKSK